MKYNEKHCSLWGIVNISSIYTAAIADIIYL